METYKSDVVTVPYNINTVYDTLSNPATLKKQLDANKDKIPTEARENLDMLEFADDAITIVSPMGSVKLTFKQLEPPTAINLEAEHSPVSFSLDINLTQVSDAETSLQAALNIDLPIFLRGMLGSQISDGTKMFGQMLAQIPYNDL